MPSIVPAVCAVQGSIDWPGIRANAVSMGIRAAARAAGAALPPDEQERFVKRVLKRAEREGWMKAKAVAMSAATVRNEKPLSSNVATGADSLALQIANDSEQTRAALAETYRRGAQHAAEMAKESPDFVIEKAKALQQITSGAGMVGGWAEKKGEEGPPISILSIGGNVNLGIQRADRSEVRE